MRRGLRVSRARSSPPRCTWVAADLAEPGTARSWSRLDPQIVIHLAGAVRGDRSLEAVHPTLSEPRADGRAPRSGDARAAFGESSQRFAARGARRTGGRVPPSPYGASRWASSMYARMFHLLFDTPVTILRPSYAYGPGQDDEKLLPHVISRHWQASARALVGRTPDRLRLRGGRRPGLCGCRHGAGIEGHTFDIGSGELSPVRDVVETLVDLIGGDCPRPALRRGARAPVRAGDRRGHGARPGCSAGRRRPLVEGPRRTVAWYRERARPAPRPT